MPRHFRNEGSDGAASPGVHMGSKEARRAKSLEKERERCARAHTTAPEMCYGTRPEHGGKTAQ